MGGITPVYNIHYPNGSTKANALGPELQQMATDVEAALVAAQIPPAQPMSIVVAASEGARNAHWGIPDSETARLALQNKGATTVRTDRGWTERYYATYNAATNPGGSTPAGWYPVEGQLPTFTCFGSGSQTIGSGGVVALTNWGVPVQYGFQSWINGVLTVAIPGVYQIAGGTALGGSAAQTLVRTTPRDYFQDGVHTSVAVMAAPLQAGNTINLSVFQASGANQSADGNRQSLSVHYIGPLK